MKPKAYPILAATALLSLALSSCNQAATPQTQTIQKTEVSVGQDAVGQDIVNKEAINVLPKNFSTQALGNNSIQSLFSQAKAVKPLQGWKANKRGKIRTQSLDTFNGYTIPFYDFYGVSFAYLNFIDKAGDTDPQALIAAGTQKTGQADMMSWNAATYASGANTMRDVVISVEEGTNILNTIYSNKAKQAGFNINKVVRYVMPAGDQHWALMQNGRYFDLDNVRFATTQEVQNAKSGYDKLVKQVADNAETIVPIFQEKWAQAEQVGATGTAEKIIPQTLNTNITDTSMSCFLWFCNESITAGNASGSLEQGFADKFYKGDIYNEYQYVVDGWLTGCGAASLAALMRWYDDIYPTKEKYVVDTLLNTQIKLRGYMGSTNFYPGGTATYPWYFISGGNQYLQKYGASVDGNWGQPSQNWKYQMEKYITKFKTNEPVVALHLSNDTQHYGLVTKFQKDAYSDLMVFVPSASKNGSWWIQSAAWYAYTTGVFVINKQDK